MNVKAAVENEQGLVYTAVSLHQLQKKKKKNFQGK